MPPDDLFVDIIRVGCFRERYLDEAVFKGFSHYPGFCNRTVHCNAHFDQCYVSQQILILFKNLFVRRTYNM
jgi:hypothetical protein